jgi:hypothetical protein
MYCFAIIAIASLLSTSPLFAARPTAARLLPENTVAMVSVADAKTLAEKFMNTDLGRMSQDPQLKPLIEHLYGSLGEFIDKLKDEIGLSLDQIAALPQGEITAALIIPADSTPGGVLVFDAKDQIENARTLIERLKKLLEREKGVKSEETIEDVKCTIYRSPDENAPEKTLVFFEKDSAIAVCINLEVAKQVLAVWTEKKDARSLAENATYATIASRCRGTKDEEPQIIWFADPINLMKGLTRDNMGLAFTVASFPALGLDGLSGVGGSMIFDTEQFDGIMHLHVALASPRTGAIKAVAFEPGSAKPEHWAPADVATYMTLNWNFDKSIKAIEKLSDSFRNEGDFAKNLENFNKEFSTDLQKEIIPALDGRVTYINWVEKPVKLTSSHTLAALKLKDKEKAVETAQKFLDAIAKKDTQGMIEKKTHAGVSYYCVNIPTPQMPEGAEPPPMPKPCFGILEDYVMFSNQEGVYRQVLSTAAGEAKPLDGELDYKLVARKLERVAGGNKPAMMAFQRPEEGFRYMYDLATSDFAKNQMNRAAEREQFWKTVSSALDKNPLPPFSVIQKYLSPNGSLVIDDETGIHLMQFTLKRKGE